MTTAVSKTRSPHEDDVRWLAVLRRDRAVDGQFVYAVESTGVYCRPSCASRRPSRSRVLFFRTSGDAERAGFRSCKRCHPYGPVTPDPWVGKVQRACVYLANRAARPSLSLLAQRFGGSPYHFQRNFKRLVGVTPREFSDACRLQVVKRRLRGSSDVTGAIFEAGYGSARGFYEGAVPKLGMTPSMYRRGGAGMTIRYAIVASPLGRLLVAATSRGVCAVSMGTADASLECALRHEYPAATIVRDDGALAAATEAILAHVSGDVPRLELPIDVQATAFQWQVWKALADIPYGETRSYGEIAASIGRARAVRAVGRACATNPVALAIPCHRVVPASGGIGGYRWGADRKQALLAGERRGR